MKASLILLALIGAVSTTVAQNRMANPVRIMVHVRESGRIEFHSENLTHIPHTVVLDFPLLLNDEPSARLPYRFIAPDTPRRVFDLRQRSSIMPADYLHSFIWYTGCVNTKPAHIEYLLPVPEGVEVGAVRAAFHGAAGEAEPPGNRYALQFTMHKGNTVTAARKSRVLEVESNSILVSHADCTFARYSGFELGGIRVREADLVFPGGVRHRVTRNVSTSGGLDHQGNDPRGTSQAGELRRPTTYLVGACTPGLVRKQNRFSAGSQPAPVATP